MAAPPGPSGSVDNSTEYIKTLKEAIKKNLDLRIDDPEFARIVQAFSTVTHMSGSHHIDSYTNALAYEGFDPLYTQECFMRSSKKHQDLIGEVKIGDITLTKRPDFMQDMGFFVLVFAARGAAVWKILDKSSKELREILSLKCGQYSVSTTRPRGGKKKTLPRTTITVPRIAALAPHWVCSLFRDGKVKPIIKRDVSGLEIPLPMCHTLFASICPSEKLLPVCYVVARRLDRVINPTSTTKMSVIKSYTKAMFDGKLYDTDQRIKWCVALGVVHITDTGVVVPVGDLKNVLAKCLDLLAGFERREERAARRRTSPEPSSTEREEEGEESEGEGEDTE
jgi:hypothetical protein